MKKNIPVYSICTIREAGAGAGTGTQPGAEAQTETRPGGGAEKEKGALKGELGPSALNVYRFGQYLSERDFLFRPHRHSFYHLVYFTGGGGEHSIDFVKFPVRIGQIYFMCPGQVHHWQFSPGKETDGYIINFSRDLFHGLSFSEPGLEQFPFFSGHCEKQVVQLPQAAQRGAMEIFEKILEETGSSRAFAIDMIRALLWELFIGVAREAMPDSPGKAPRPGYPVLRHFETLVDEHYTMRKLPKEYAEMLHVTPNYLNALCTRALGKPAGTVIRDRVILEAKRLLVNVDQSISEIAFQLNFPDNSYFTKFFKKYTGNTPEGFRKLYH
jgi:AraC-like DNA-binding protein